MKKKLVLLLLVSSLYATSQITLGYNRSNIGKNIRFGYEFELVPNLIIEPGLKYIVWTEVYDNRGYAFKDRFRPINFLEHFGLFTSLKFQVYQSEYFNIRIMYNGAITNSHLITDDLLYYINTVYDANGNPIDEALYHRVFQERPKTFAFENYIGVETNIKLSKRLDCFAQTGLGYVFYHVQDDPRFIVLEPNSGEYSWFMGTLGLKYYFKKP